MLYVTMIHCNTQMLTSEPVCCSIGDCQSDVRKNCALAHLNLRPTADCCLLLPAVCLLSAYLNVLHCLRSHLVSTAYFNGP